MCDHFDGLVYWRGMSGSDPWMLQECSYFHNEKAARILSCKVTLFERSFGGWWEQPSFVNRWMIYQSRLESNKWVAISSYPDSTKTPKKDCSMKKDSVALAPKKLLPTYIPLEECGWVRQIASILLHGDDGEADLGHKTQLSKDDQLAWNWRPRIHQIPVQTFYTVFPLGSDTAAKAQNNSNHYERKQRQSKSKRRQERQWFWQRGRHTHTEREREPGWGGGTPWPFPLT